MTDIPPAPNSSSASGSANSPASGSSSTPSGPALSHHRHSEAKPLEIQVESKEHELLPRAEHRQEGHEEHDPEKSHHNHAAEPLHHKHHERFHVTEKFLRITTIIGLVAWFAIAILLSILMGENPFFVFLGLSPVIFTIVVTYILIDQYHVENGFLMVFPAIFSGIFMVMGAAGWLGNLDWQLLTVVNFVCGIFFEAVLIMQHSFIHIRFQAKDPEPELEEKKELVIGDNVLKIEIMGAPEQTVAEQQNPLTIQLNTDDDVRKFVANIEDKAKAINAVIGRVYSVRHGGVESMRRRIRIDPEHYNGFNELKDKRAAKRKAAAIKLLNKILDTLKQLKETEEDVFQKNDWSSLVNLERDVNGQDKIIDVLAKNDSDPVKTYYDGAIQFCQDAVKLLRAEEKVARAQEKAKRAAKKAEDKIKAQKSDNKPEVQLSLKSEDDDRDDKKSGAAGKAAPKGRLVLKKDQLRRLAHKKQMKKELQQLKLR